MIVTARDYNAMVAGFKRLEPIVIKEYGSIDKYYKALWLHACKVSDYPKTRYIWDCFWDARFRLGRCPMREPYYNVVTDNDYKDCNLETAVKRYLKSKGFDYYDK